METRRSFCGSALPPKTTSIIVRQKRALSILCLYPSFRMARFPILIKFLNIEIGYLPRFDGVRIYYNLVRRKTSNTFLEQMTHCDPANLSPPPKGNNEGLKNALIGSWPATRWTTKYDANVLTVASSINYRLRQSWKGISTPKGSKPPAVFNGRFQSNKYFIIGCTYFGDLNKHFVVMMKGWSLRRKD